MVESAGSGVARASNPSTDANAEFEDSLTYSDMSFPEMVSPR